MSNPSTHSNTQILRSRLAKPSDIDSAQTLLNRYTKARLSEAQQQDGFLSASFSKEQLHEYLQPGRILCVAVDPQQDVVGVLMASSWPETPNIPILDELRRALCELRCQGKPLSENNSCCYGPICIDEAYRGRGIGEQLIAVLLQECNGKYDFMVNFVSRANPRSYQFHLKNGFEASGSFEFNGEAFWVMSAPV